MGKLILFLLVAVAVYWWLRKPRTTAPRSRPAAADQAEAMVSCAYCGLHVPLGESIVADGRHYCSAEHRDLDGGRNSH